MRRVIPCLIVLFLPMFALSACAQSVSMPYTDTLYCSRYNEGWYTRSTRAPLPATGTATTGRLTVQLGLAEGKWHAAGIKHYRITIERFCYCENTGPYTIEVRDEAVIMAPSVCAPYQSGNCFDVGQDATSYTVSGMFAILQRELRDPCRKVDATFNAAYGFPAHVGSGPTVDAFDIGFGLTVIAFVPLP